MEHHCNNLVRLFLEPPASATVPRLGVPSLSQVFSTVSVHLKLLPSTLACHLHAGGDCTFSALRPLICASKARTLPLSTLAKKDSSSSSCKLQPCIYLITRIGRRRSAKLGDTMHEGFRLLYNQHFECTGDRSDLMIQWCLRSQVL